MSKVVQTYPDGSELTNNQIAGAILVGYIAGVGGFLAVGWIARKIQQKKADKFVQDMNQILGESN